VISTGVCLIRPIASNFNPFIAIILGQRLSTVNEAGTIAISHNFNHLDLYALRNCPDTAIWKAKSNVL